MGRFSSRKPKIAKLKRKGDLDGLSRALRYRETVVDEEGEWDLGVDVRVGAAEALSDFDGTAVSEDLADALDDPQPTVRLAAIDSLSKLGIPAAVEKLADCVAAREDDAEEVSDRALDVLVEWRVEGPAERVVERLTEPVAPPLDDRHRDAVERLLAADPRGDDARKAIADRMIARLQSEPADAFDSRAERVLGWLGAPGLDSVIDALEDGSATPALVRAAGLGGDARAVDPVIRALGSPDAEMRRAAAMAAGALNHSQAVPELVGATQDSDQGVRDAATAALNRIGMAAVVVGLASLIVSTAERAPELRANEDAGAGEHLPRGATTEDGPPASPAVEPSPLPPRRRGGLVERLLGRIE